MSLVGVLSRIVLLGVPVFAIVRLLEHAGVDRKVIKLVATLLLLAGYAGFRLLRRGL